MGFQAGCRARARLLRRWLLRRRSGALAVQGWAACDMTGPHATSHYLPWAATAAARRGLLGTGGSSSAPPLPSAALRQPFTWHPPLLTYSYGPGRWRKGRVWHLVRNPAPACRRRHARTSTAARGPRAEHLRKTTAALASIRRRSGRATGSLLKAIPGQEFPAGCSAATRGCTMHAGWCLTSFQARHQPSCLTTTQRFTVFEFGIGPIVGPPTHSPRSKAECVTQARSLHRARGTSSACRGPRSPERGHRHCPWTLCCSPLVPNSCKEPSHPGLAQPMQTIPSCWAAQIPHARGSASRPVRVGRSWARLQGVQRPPCPPAAPAAGRKSRTRGMRAWGRTPGPPGTGCAAAWHRQRHLHRRWPPCSRPGPSRGWRRPRRRSPPCRGPCSCRGRRRPGAAAAWVPGRPWEPTNGRLAGSPRSISAGSGASSRATAPRPPAWPSLRR
mmetsp:Transcript_99477/g.297199  ORF Transcript_99477/g.297199 Transcript_99477/m.297199 type:complete len:444 (-) Transcript_99477:1323-2654(-)